MRIGFAIKVLLITATIIVALKLVRHRFGRKYGESAIKGAYKNFKIEYNIKAASPEEDKYRYQVFRNNYKKMEKHNADKTQTWQMGITQFAAMPQQEFIQKILMSTPITSENTDNYMPTVQAPKAGIDWRTKKAVTAVKNQGSCGSCWAFSTTGAIESAYLIKGKSVLLSEQQLVDCCGALGYQCQGCRGAWPEWSFKFVQDKGLVSTSEYPYTARDGQCKIQSGPNKISGFKQLANSPAALQAGLVQGPVSVCVDASNWSMYRSGVFSNCRSALNHAVLAVGYDDSQWHIKNSWGSWGESGYIRLAPGNTCGVTSHAIIPTA